MAVRKLASARSDDPEHRPQSVGDGHGLLEVPGGEQHTDAAALGSFRVFLRALEFGHHVFARVEGRLKTRLGFMCTEVREEGRVVDHIEGRVFFRVVNGADAGQGHEIARVPLNGPFLRLGASAPANDKVEFAACIGRGRYLLPRPDAREAGQKAGAGRGVGSAKVGAQVERNDAALTRGVEAGAKLLDWNSRGRPGLDRVGSLAVFEDLRIASQDFGGNERCYRLSAHRVSPEEFCLILLFHISEYVEIVLARLRISTGGFWNL